MPNIPSQAIGLWYCLDLHHYIRIENERSLKMNKAIYKKFWLPSVVCIFMISFLLPFPMPCHGADCDFDVEVSPYQVNIDSGGVDHYVRILTYARYADTYEAFVYIDDNESPIDSQYIELVRDRYGHLVVKIDLIALQDADLEVETYHNLKIVVELKAPEDSCLEQEGTGEIYIISQKADKKG